MSGLGLRRGVWWFHEPNGTWLRWDSEWGKWERASLPPPPPLPCEVAEPRRSLSVDDYSSVDVELFQSVVGQLRFVTSMFWQQANFFILIQGGLLTVVASQFIPKVKTQPLLPLLLLSALGLLLAGFWGFIAWNRVWIIKKWNYQVKHLDREIDRHLVYQNVLQELEDKGHRRPTHLARFIPWLLAAGWIALLIWSPLAHYS
jgi:hypothetical protein